MVAVWRSGCKMFLLPSWALMFDSSALQKFNNVDRDEYHTDMSTLASPASQNSPDVYILPLTEVSLPVAKQPSRSGESRLFCLTNSHLLLIKPTESRRVARQHQPKRLDKFQKLLYLFTANKNTVAQHNHSLWLVMRCQRSATRGGKNTV